MTTDLAHLKPRPRRGNSARVLPSQLSESFQRRLANAEAAVAEPFKGVTTDGSVQLGLFTLSGPGAPTETMRQATQAYLAALPDSVRDQAMFPVESDAWRRWSNIHPFTMRHGVLLESLDDAGRERALDVLRASLSEAGFQTARDVMRLNETIRELTEADAEYGEWLYWLSVFGTPDATEPWGWQIDGHHLIVNCLVLGEQTVMTPAFLGSEPTVAETGKYAGTRVFEAEERQGLAVMQALTHVQRLQAVIADEMPGDVFTSAFRDNLEMRQQGVPFSELEPHAQGRLLELLGTYVGRQRPDHARVRMEEVQAHLAETTFAWIGAWEPDSVFYYRVQSPVILVEFDHQHGTALEVDHASRNHIHTVVRTPNGNDYGKDLLRQHYERAHAASQEG